MILATGAALLGAAAGTSYSGVVRLVQWCVIVLVFIFFLRVIRAVWVEVRPAGPRQTRRERRQAARDEQRLAAALSRERAKGRRRLQLEVVEPGDRAGTRFVVHDDASIGRGAANAISTTDDAYTSTQHARVFIQGGKLWVEDLGSTNGTYVNSERIAKPEKLGRGDLLQVGATVFEVVR